MLVKRDGKHLRGRVTKILVYEGLRRVETQKAMASFSSFLAAISTRFREMEEAARK